MAFVDRLRGEYVHPSCARGTRDANMCMTTGEWGRTIVLLFVIGNPTPASRDIRIWKKGDQDDQPPKATHNGGGASVALAKRAGSMYEISYVPVGSRSWTFEGHDDVINLVHGTKDQSDSHDEVGLHNNLFFFLLLNERGCEHSHEAVGLQKNIVSWATPIGTAMSKDIRSRNTSERGPGAHHRRDP